MKKTRIAIMAAAILVCGLAFNGCTTTQQTTAYNTISAVETTASTAYDGYCQLVIKGVVPTNSVPQVSQKFNQLQLACTLAASASQAGTNGLASDTLTSELVELTTLIAALAPPKH